MTERTLTVDGVPWVATPSGRRTQYTKDEFGVIFTRTDGAKDEQRVARYRPRSIMHSAASLGRMSLSDLENLFRRSQPSWTSPELGYRR